MLESTFGVLSVLVGAITQVVKQFGIPSKLMPVIAIVIGIILNFGFQFVGEGTNEIVLNGLVAGLVACGLYDVATRAVGGVKK